jgi:hypothetical protein
MVVAMTIFSLFFISSSMSQLGANIELLESPAKLWYLFFDFDMLLSLYLECGKCGGICRRDDILEQAC